ncbi:hypothetical protein ACVWYN_001639 [Pedobacter sp. UYP24]
MTNYEITYQDQIARQALSSFRYAMLSKLIFAQYSFS